MFELLALCPVVIVDLQTGHIGSGLLAEYLRQTVSGVLQHGLWLPPAILGVVWLAFAWRYYRTIVQDEIHASPLPRAEAPQLCQLAETLAISAGLPTPRLLVIESEARNAFAIGFSPADAAIFVTRGLLERLAPDEIEAVLAHEISHIANRDTRLPAAAALSAGIVMRLAWLLAALFLRASPLIKLILYLCAGYYFLDVLGLIAWACLFATICALAARLAISQARELVADACAIELTKNPDALISALRKMHGHEQVAGLDLFLQAMLISPTNGHLFVAHPPLEARVVVLQRLLPSMVKPDRSPEPHRVAETLWSWRQLAAEIAAVNPPAWIFNWRILAPVTAINLLLAAAFAVTIESRWSPGGVIAQSLAPRGADAVSRIRASGADRCFPTKLRFDATPMPFEPSVENAATARSGVTLTAWHAQTTQPRYEVSVAHRDLIKARKNCGPDACSGPDLQACIDAFKNYVDRRRALTELMQQIYGAPGRDAMPIYFETPQDRAIVADFRNRTIIGQIDLQAAMAGLSDANAAAMDLLLSRPPEDFKPCVGNLFE